MTQFIDHSLETVEKISTMTDLMMGLMAAEIEVQIKTSGNTPKDKGNLRSSARNVRIEKNHYEVWDTADYAAAQEAGMINGHPITHYTEPGTGAHYFQKAIENVEARSGEFAHKAMRATGLEII